MEIEHSSPEDCQTSQEAYEIADIMKTFGESELNSTGDEFTAASALNAARFFKDASAYYKRGDELKAQRK